MVAPSAPPATPSAHFAGHSSVATRSSSFLTSTLAETRRPDWESTRTSRSCGTHERRKRVGWRRTISGLPRSSSGRASATSTRASTFAKSRRRASRTRTYGSSSTRNVLVPSSRQPTRTDRPSTSSVAARNCQWVQQSALGPTGTSSIDSASSTRTSGSFVWRRTPARASR